ncbi:MAG: M6 family metalloprotease domain-containing protein [Candidatus Krumholzibacteriia bacterium]
MAGATVLAAALLVVGAAAARAIVPPAPGAGGLAAPVSPALRAAGFGRSSRPIVTPRFALAEKGAGAPGAAAAATAVTGSRRLPVLLGDTSDRLATQPSASFAAELFGAWPTGSMTDYYAQVSYGRFSVTGDVFGWYRLASPMTYYEGAAGCNGLCSYPANAGGFVRQLVALADAGGFDWSAYDNDGPDGLPNSGDDDGYVDAVIIVHAGKGGECGGNNAIWSHSFSLRGWGATAYTTRTPRAGGGYLKVDDYIIQPELSCGGGLIEIGVFCHEYGHALGLPDLYDTDGGGQGAGNWCLMSGGSWGGDGRTPAVPSQLCAWSKAFLGWLAPEAVREDGPCDFPTVEQTPLARRIWTEGRTASQYFLAENRQRVLNDANLPGAGLLIWHVDEDVIAAGWATNMVNAGPVYGVALEQADGLEDLAIGRDRGDAGDPWPGSAVRTVFDDTTLPSTRANDGTATRVIVKAIPTAAATVSPLVEVGVPAADLTAPTATVVAPNGGEAWPTGSTQSLLWSASDARGVAAVRLQLSRDGGATWPETLADGLADSGAWEWQTPALPAANLRVRVVALDAAGNAGTDISDADFAVTDQYRPGVLVTAPAGGEIWAGGAVTAVNWSAADNVAVTAIDLLLSTDGGVTWADTVATGLANSGHYDWSVPRSFSEQCRLLVRARDAAGNAGADTSALFTLANLTAVGDTPGPLRVGGFPNPFNPATTIRFYNPVPGPVEVAVLDLVGRRVRTLLSEVRPAGAGAIRWDGRDQRGAACASGVYHVQATAGGTRAWVMVTLVR